MARLVGIDLITGMKTDDIDLSGLVAGNHFPNDLTFDGQQNTYITDSFANVIYKVQKTAKHRFLQIVLFLRQTELVLTGLFITRQAIF